jgi:hypothetical protein
MEVLIARARGKVAKMQKLLVPPMSDDFKFAPHVAADRLRQIAVIGEELDALAKAAKV